MQRLAHAGTSDRAANNVDAARTHDATGAGPRPMIHSRTANSAPGTSAGARYTVYIPSSRSRFSGAITLVGPGIRTAIGTVRR